MIEEIRSRTWQKEEATDEVQSRQIAMSNDVSI
jgi:hypothetical protein